MVFLGERFNFKFIFLFLILVGAGLLFYFLNTKKHFKGPETFFRGKMIDLKMPKEKIKKVVLDNGMTILVFQNDSVPKVLVQIAYDIGSYVEEQGERGLAHLIEHMIFKGTENLSETDIDSIAKKYGATLNAYTSNDMTSYFFETDKNNWKPFIGILSDCMQNARFDSQHLASELKAVIQELRMYKDIYWRAMIDKSRELLFPTNHPYHRPVIGYKEELMDLSAENLKNFYKKHYTPDHATLFIVGDVDIDDAITFAKKNFEKIKGPEKQINYIEKYFPKSTKDLIINKTITYEDVKNEQLGFYWQIPGLRSKVDVITNVIEVVLGEGQGSRLHKRLVDEEKIATSVGVFSYQLMEDGIFLIFVEPLSGQGKKCRQVIETEIENLIKNGITEKELQKVIKSKRRVFFQEMQTLSGFTNEWIQSYLAHKDEFELFDKINQFNKIDSEQIQKFTAKYLDPFLMNQIEVLPIPQNKKNLWEQNKKESEELDKKILTKYQRTSQLEETKFAKTLANPNKLDFKFPSPTKNFKLDNGLDVIIYKDHYWPIFTVNCQFKDAEYLSESKDSILLGLMMSMLIEGSQEFSKQQIVEFFEDHGASVSLDEVGGRISGLSEDFNYLLDRFFNVLTKPKFNSDSLEKLKIVFIDMCQRAKDSAKSIGIRLLKNEIYKGYPYNWTFDEAIEMLQKITIKDLQALHKKYVSPKNMVLTIAGSFDLSDIENKIKDIFSLWSGEKLEFETWGKSEFIPNKTIDEFMLRDQVLLYLGRPSPINIYNEDLIPIKVLNLICFSSLGSRLYKVRERTGLFYNASGGLALSATKENGFDFIRAILSVDKLDFALNEILKMLDDISQNGVTQEELNAAAQQYLKGLIDLTASNEALSMMFARLKSYELGFDYYSKVLNRVQNIKLEDLNQIAAKYFTSKNFDLIRVGRVK